MTKQEKRRRTRNEQRRAERFYRRLVAAKDERTLRNVRRDAERAGERVLARFMELCEQ